MAGASKCRRGRNKSKSKPATSKPSADNPDHNSTSTKANDKSKSTTTIISNLRDKTSKLRIEPSRPKQALTKPTTPSLFKLPKEILEIILKHALTHPLPIPVNPLFARQNPYFPPALDYRILFSSTELYHTGIRHYYSLNTFSISLQMFRTAPTTLAPDRWPKMCGLPLASMFVRKLHVSTRGIGQWADALKLLRGFERLDKVVFDTRHDHRVDERNDGGMLRFDWVEVPALLELYEALRKGGVAVADGTVFVGNMDVLNAEFKRDCVVTPELREAVGL